MEVKSEKSKACPAAGGVKSERKDEKRETRNESSQKMIVERNKCWSVNIISRKYKELGIGNFEGI